MIGKIPVWLTVVILVGLFFPLYYVSNHRDATDVFASFATVSALMTLFIYKPSLWSILRSRNCDLSEREQFLLLGVLLTSSQTVTARVFGIWWRFYGDNDPAWYAGAVPAFIAYIAFLGYFLHVIAPPQPENAPWGVRMAYRYRVFVNLALGGAIGAALAYLSH